jgi:glycosyltransferase involved in cell wall biosynthesis
MACGLPVIASPVGVNVDIVEPGVNGLLAGAGPQWTAALETLASDPDLRARLGRNGRCKVIDHYSLSAMTPRLIALLHGDFSVAEQASGPMAALG